jgi:hypothetical protein
VVAGQRRGRSELRSLADIGNLPGDIECRCGSPTDLLRVTVVTYRINGIPSAALLPHSPLPASLGSRSYLGSVRDTGTNTLCGRVRMPLTDVGVQKMPFREVALGDRSVVFVCLLTIELHRTSLPFVIVRKIAAPSLSPSSVSRNIIIASSHNTSPQDDDQVTLSFFFFPFAPTTAALICEYSSALMSNLA